jgi:ribonuclease R
MPRRVKRQKGAQALDVNAVLAALGESEEGLSARDLAELLDLSRDEQKSLAYLLNRLQGVGLLRRHGQEFVWRPSPRVAVGTLRQRRGKVIRFVPDDAHERARGPLRVAPEETNGAFDGDRVVAAVARHQAGREREARVELILQRGQLRVVGRLQRAFNRWWVESLDEKFPHDVDVEAAREDEDGHVVVVEITDYPTGHEGARGEVVERLGASSSEPGLDIEVVIRKHDLPHVFPPEVLAEADAVAPVVTDEQRAGRLDLRDVMTVTIDGETARDFDDAISLSRLDNGNYGLGVHIADVSYYVREATALDEEARLRGTSVYFPERAIPMLPEKLSNGICSLKPRVDRLAMSALMEVSGEGRVVGYQLRETVIRSDERMTYTNVNKILSHADAEATARYAAFVEFFKVMEELARGLIKMRERRGAIDFNLPEAVFEFNDEGHVAGVIKAERNIAHRIIEEFMLLANECVAGHFERLGVPSIYRVHEEPEPQRVIEFAELAAAYGYRFPVEGVSSFDYQRLSAALAGKPEERVLAYAMLRSLKRARYTARNVGHFGLAAPVYTHFTSPIRRYPDLIVHRVLRALLRRSPALGEGRAVESAAEEGKAGKRRKLAPIALQELELMAEESSERERAADAAEAELEEWRKAVLMAGKVGEEFGGMVVNVREFGLFVELDGLFVEGLVPVASLADDYYDFDARRHALVGRQRRRVFRLGDRVRVRVERVNVDRHLVDFSVVAHEPPAAKPGL